MRHLVREWMGAWVGTQLSKIVYEGLEGLRRASALRAITCTLQPAAPWLAMLVSLQTGA